MEEATAEKPIIIGVARRGSYDVLVTPMFNLANVGLEDLNTAPFGIPDEHGDVVDLKDGDGFPIPLKGTTYVTTGNYRTAELLIGLGARRMPTNCMTVMTRDS
ncbi:MAG: hypothetical protein ACD_78C00458G0001 [uncultured bacterium (gcode 4)]|uniref:Uncharacterized protein n=1 Tax=uncultured bacterium (gcode 4) TaxID=1234023 RepID=K1YVK2_9BACT|nr:MAG: hypothetical protein ACD_78C00458G0001 [uncultured bacterium (gcode 4)]